MIFFVDYNFVVFKLGILSLWLHFSSWTLSFVDVFSPWFPYPAYSIEYHGQLTILLRIDKSFALAEIVYKLYII